MKLTISRLLCLGCIALTACLTAADAVLSKAFSVCNVYSNHMVLQRRKPIQIYGKAEPGSVVKVDFLGTSTQATTKANGLWFATLPAQEAGGPYELTVSGDPSAKPIVFTDVMVGEVWLCSGQSNMAMPVWSNGEFWRAKDGDKLAQAMQNPNVRIFDVGRIRNPDGPAYDVADYRIGWQPATKLNLIHRFSAIGFFFACDLQKELNIPIGVISSNWGGTPIYSWMSYEMLKGANVPRYFNRVAYFRDAAIRAVMDEDFAKHARDYQKRATDWDRKFIAPHTAAIKQAIAWKNIDCDLTGWTKLRIFPEDVYGTLGVKWYRTTIDIPETMTGKDLTLNLGRIDDCDMTFFNGTKVGQTMTNVKEYWMATRSYTIPAKLVRAGKNTIALRVFNLNAAGGLMGDKKDIVLRTQDKQNPLSIPLDKAEWYTRDEFIANLDKIGPRPEPVSDKPTNTSASFPTTLYNAMIAPWTYYPMRGFLWYQGENDAGNPRDYMKMHIALIKGWRKLWGDDTMPFIFAQLAAYYSHTPAKPVDMKVLRDMPPQGRVGETSEGFNGFVCLREVQTATLNYPYTGMAVTIDIGNPSDIHPNDKLTLAHRMAAEAGRLCYGRTAESMGPMYDHMTIEGNKIRIHYTHIGSGLVTKDGKDPGSFAIGGKTGNFVWANARIEGDTIVVWSDEIKEPHAVRYAWARYPMDTNLYNKEGFPACPFRTDQPSYLLKKTGK